MLKRWCRKTRHLCAWMFRFSKRVTIILVVTFITFVVLMLTGRIFAPPAWVETVLVSVGESAVDATARK